MTNRLNEWLLSISHSNVLRGINATLLSRSATTEYGRRASFSAAPSPNHEPAGTPAKVVQRPSLETVSLSRTPRSHLASVPEEILDDRLRHRRNTIVQRHLFGRARLAPRSNQPTKQSVISTTGTPRIAAWQHSPRK